MATAIKRPLAPWRQRGLLTSGFSQNLGWGCAEAHGGGVQRTQGEQHPQRCVAVSGDMELGSDWTAQDGCTISATRIERGAGYEKRKHIASQVSGKTKAQNRTQNRISPFRFTNLVKV